MSRKPILFDLDEDAATDVAAAPPVPDTGSGLGGPAPSGQAMQIAARLAGRRSSRLVRLFWGLLGAAIGAIVGLAAWNFVASLLVSWPVVGWVVTGIFGALLLVALLLALRELAAFARLGRIDHLRRKAYEVAASDNLEDARALARDLVGFYRGRDEVTWGRERLSERVDDQFDASAVIALAEAELLAPLDAAATREVEAAARQVAAVTALVPIALADVVTALTASLRMIRRIAEIYGGRSGFFESWRLTRAVFAHLVATGAVAAGDDLIEPLLGGSLLTKLSRRFGEGLVNGALSARVGVAAMEVCRPLPFGPGRKPSVRGIVQRSLTGIFGSRD